MKIWKMVGSLTLLAIIICGCVILGQSAEVAAQSDPEQKEEEAQQQEQQEEQQEEQQQQDSSATVPKVYSTGLQFRSNGDGTCAVAGLGSCTAACVLIPPTSPTGDTVTAILPGAFADSVVGAIELPSTVISLSAESFTGAVRLRYIRVSEGNTAYLEYDGALYSADGKTLLYCPAGRTAKELTLHTSLQRIAAGAFAECTALTTVYFEGTTSEWHTLIVGDDNDPLYAANLKFTP